MPAHVVSVSRRTDVPSFHVPWFLRRLREGFAEYRNPFSGKLHRVSLAPGDVRAFVFWTRNPAPLMRELRFLERRGTPFYFLYTLTGYPRRLERATPPLAHAVKTFRQLAERIGPRLVRWRYDPIVVSREMDAEYHLRNFERIASALSGATEACIVSYLDFYGKVQLGLESVERAHGPQEFRREPDRALALRLAEVAGGFGMRMLACCEDAWVGEGIGKARCVDPELLEGIAPANGGMNIRPTREECGCAASRDIGGYNTCPHGCVYCYANRSPEAARAHYRARDAARPFL